jgi:hypothetical protein
MSGTSIFTSRAAWITPWATQPEGGRNPVLRGAAVDVEEVGGLAARVLDHVHGGHGQTRAVDDAADLTLEADVGEIVLGGLGLARVALRGIVHVGDVAPAEHGIVVEGHLGVEGQDAVVLGDDERVDLQHRAVTIAERPVGVHDRLHGGRDLADVEAELERDLARLELLQADSRLDHDLDQGLGLVGGDFLDIHAAALRGDDPDALGLPVEDVAEVEFALEGVGGLDIDALDGLALRSGLDRHEALAEEILGRVADLVVGPAQLDAAGLAAGARMDLRLHGPERSTEFGCCVDRLIGAEGNGTLRNGHAETGEQLLGLVLVHVHERSPWRFFPWRDCLVNFTSRKGLGHLYFFRSTFTLP